MRTPDAAASRPADQSTIESDTMDSSPTSDLTLASTVRLNSGVQMPRLGLGVWQTKPGEETRRAVSAALEIGYRLIDTAAAYGNEKGVGEAVRASDIPREEIFVTTKLWNDQHGYERALRAFHQSLHELGLRYVDLYLIHWPVANGRRDSWRALERLAADGLCRSIGVSNYTVKHLEELLRQSDTMPDVNQVEFHPFLDQRDLLEFCHERGIRLEAYSPLARGERLRHPRLVELGRRYGKTAAQVLIRWSLQHDLVAIPKSARRDRIAENADVFDFRLEPEDMSILDALGEGLRICWDPTGMP
jgi:diketogulonate reductase-like aldo/keto reductase